MSCLGSSDNAAETGDDSPAGVDLWTEDQTLEPGESATYAAWYIIDQTAANSGKVINTAIATADTPLSGDEATLSVTSAEAVVDIAPIPSISISKEPTAIEDGDNNILDVDETVLYTITVTNDGNIELIGVQDPVDVVKDLTGTAFTSQSVAVTYQGSSFDGLAPPANSFDGTLAVGESVMFEALLTIDQAMVDAAGVVNTASVLGYDNTGATVSDSVSTDAIEIEASPSLTVTKKADVDHIGDADIADRVVRADDRIYYTISVINTGNVTLTDLAVVDALTDGAGNDLVMTSDPTNQWTIASLAPGEEWTDEPYYEIDSAAALTGSISNVVTVTGDTPNGTDDITAISDDPEDTTSDQDPTVVETDLISGFAITKQAFVIDNGDGNTGAGDIIHYEIKITNTGEVTISDIVLTDNFRAGDLTTLYLDSPDSHSAGNLTPGIHLHLGIMKKKY